MSAEPLRFRTAVGETFRRRFSLCAQALILSAPSTSPRRSVTVPTASTFF